MSDATGGANLSRSERKTAVAVTGVALIIVAVLTAALGGLGQVVNVETVTIIYLIPVLFAALRGGVVPALVTSLSGVAASAYFFYPPIYDFRVQRPIHLIDLILFVTVALVVGQLATTMRRSKMREHGDALREAIIGSVSHELRTPLASIVGSASVLAQSRQVADDPRLASLVHGMRQEAERLNGHIQNLLDATRISSDGIRPHAEWVDPGDIINTAVRNKDGLMARLRCEVMIPDGLPLLLLDSSMIERALGQLIENAVKYSPPQSLIEIGAEHVDQVVRFWVRNQGGGLTPDEHDKIWQRFYRSPRHANIAGSGLGLWIARALVEACGGRISAHSDGLGKGAVFAISLPVPHRANPRTIESADEQ
jgi:two-component system sensor histidine kinase KdpD